MKILCIGPNQQQAMLLEQYLKLGSFGKRLNFYHANTMREVVVSILNEQFDLIVIDPDFPNLGGMGLIKVLDENISNTPIVAIHLDPNNSCRKECAMVCLEYGAQWHFHRVSELEQVIELLSTAGQTN
ncbi:MULTISPECIES: hypothetical protein [unclassified Nitrospina]|uniref:hypothetical protein n=1 Tax=unclassified Nitrospina TaxID=2638683 RepID=UPI003F9553E4